MRLRHDFRERELHLGSGLRVREREAVGNAKHMCIDGNGALSKGDGQHDICRFPADARDGEQFIHRFWHVATEAVDERTRGRDDALCLDAIKAQAFNDQLNVASRGVCERVRRRILFKQLGNHHVDASVGSLRRQNDGDQQLKEIFVMQCGRRAGIGAFEPPQDLRFTIAGG